VADRDGVEPLPEVRVIGLPGLPEVVPGDDLDQLISDAVRDSGLGLEENDVVVVTHKVVSKAEGRLVELATIGPSDLALRFAAAYGKDARQVEVVLREAKRIVRMDRGVIIAETQHGFICANAGVDASNVASETVCLLPLDPDSSARRIRERLRQAFGVAPGVIVSDSFGRPWRSGIVNVAIGVDGIAPLADYRGYLDPAGYEMHVSVLAVADELASAAELVMNKLDRRPVVLIRGYRAPTESRSGTGRDLVLDPSRNLFP
jgi:coenzyme F420-0:L-glutamate ligase / coenzyme F420-1:gamma-L-glutamate ligase